MKKAEAEKAIRYLCHEWSKATGIPMSAGSEPSFSEFTQWVRAKGYGSYLEFRSVMGASYDAEAWFDEEFKQMWRR